MNKSDIAVPGTIELITKAEIDQQIATAKKYPRDIKEFRSKVRTLAVSSPATAAECFYSLPRDGKTIKGPSARFAELLAYAYGNCRAGGRIVAQEYGFIVAQGVFHDLENNSANTSEVRRRITDKNGNQYSTDMIAVTANAAASIAIRNAVMKGIPRPLWETIYDECLDLAAGGSDKPFSERRAAAIKHLNKLGMNDDQICRALQVKKTAQITEDRLIDLIGMATALKEGTATPETLANGGAADLADAVAGNRRSAPVADINAEIEQERETEADTGPGKDKPAGEPTAAPGGETGGKGKRPRAATEPRAAGDLLEPLTLVDCFAMINRAKTPDDLDIAADACRGLKFSQQNQKQIDDKIAAKRAELTPGQ